ncbi:MAG TPA: hypothetical protein VGV67_02875, partial [Solirubrobacteraceae bacterium]|nr:hypothetical protein [Solirubrobacteraceae bacterium]
RMAVPLALAGTGVLTFVAIGAAGLSLVPRYVTVPAVALCVLAGYALLGYTTLERGRTRERWVRLSVAALAAGLVFLGVKASSFARLHDELRFIDRTHDELTGLLAEPRVREGLRCGALTFPTYRLVPDARWQLDADAGAVHTRAGGRPPGAIAVYITGDEKFERRFGRADGVARETNRAPGGAPAVVHGPFAAYDVCRGRAR